MLQLCPLSHQTTFTKASVCHPGPPTSHMAPQNSNHSPRQVLVFSHFIKNTEAQRVERLAQAKAKMRGGVAGFHPDALNALACPLAEQERKGRASARSASHLLTQV